MNSSAFPNKTSLDCLVLGHYDLGFDFHENLVRSRGLTSGDYRNLRMDFITLDDRKMPYLDVLNSLTGQQLHWTEMTQVAPVYLTSLLRSMGINADFASFFPPRRGELEDLLASRPLVVAVTTTLYLTPLIAKEVVKYVRERSPESKIIVGGPPQKCVYTDTAGHIGYYSAGRIPVRKTGDGSLPYDGSTSLHRHDQLADWLNVTPPALPFAREAIEAAAREVLELRPPKGVASQDSQ